jgi:hypothetical protein
VDGEAELDEEGDDGDDGDEVNTNSGAEVNSNTNSGADAEPGQNVNKLSEQIRPNRDYKSIWSGDQTKIFNKKTLAAEKPGAENDGENPGAATETPKTVTPPSSSGDKSTGQDSKNDYDSANGGSSRSTPNNNIMVSDYNLS